MTPRPVRIPGPDHPITVSPAGGRVVVRHGDKVIVDTLKALVLQESTYAPVYYVPREDADMGALSATAHHSYCPYKGEASYLSLPGVGDGAANAIWSYEKPYDSVSAIAGHLAFYADRVSIEHTPD